MDTPVTYIPSRLLIGQAGALRRESMTRWMSGELAQAALDFCRNIGLMPVYCETSPDRLTRFLFWKVPKNAQLELRGGRTREKFEEADVVSRESGRQLLSLHINECDIYSAVWIAQEHYVRANAYLLAHGITAAVRQDTLP